MDEWKGKCHLYKYKCSSISTIDVGYIIDDEQAV